MAVLAISDLHVERSSNRRAIEEMEPRPGDWLIVAGDVAHEESGFLAAMEILASKFQKVIWTPGNHELWTYAKNGTTRRGEAKYGWLVAACRSLGIVTPEDPFPIYRGDEGALRIVPMFLLYDYTFRPDHVAAKDAVRWAKEDGIVCRDEQFLFPDPHDSREAWCSARVAATEKRLAALNDGLPTILVNHYPLRQDLAMLPHIPRFLIWCGTRATENWHVRFNASVVVTGHLHVRTTQWRDGVAFEEVSLGYPAHWRPERGLLAYMRPIVPHTPMSGRQIRDLLWYP